MRILSLSHSLSHTHTQPERQTHREKGVIVRIHSAAWRLDRTKGYYFRSESKQGDMLTCSVFSASWSQFGWVGKYTSILFSPLSPAMS